MGCSSAADAVGEQVVATLELLAEYDLEAHRLVVRNVGSLWRVDWAQIADSSISVSEAIAS